MRIDREAKRRRRVKALDNWTQTLQTWKDATDENEIRSLLSSKFLKEDLDKASLQRIRKMKIDNSKAMISILKERV
jgi:hypothetical protein